MKLYGPVATSGPRTDANSLGPACVRKSVGQINFGVALLMRYASAASLRFACRSP